jgi:hypothetical protein
MYFIRYSIIEISQGELHKSGAERKVETFDP